jgi:hypothetical protein
VAELAVGVAAQLFHGARSEHSVSHAPMALCPSEYLYGYDGDTPRLAHCGAALSVSWCTATMTRRSRRPQRYV